MERWTVWWWAFIIFIWLILLLIPKPQTSQGTSGILPYSSCIWVFKYKCWHFFMLPWQLANLMWFTWDGGASKQSIFFCLSRSIICWCSHYRLAEKKCIHGAVAHSRAVLGFRLSHSGRECRSLFFTRIRQSGAGLRWTLMCSAAIIEPFVV